MFLALSSFPALRGFILSTRFSLTATAIYKRHPAHRRWFHERIHIRETYSALLPFPCFYLPHEVAAGTRGWTRRISQRKHTALLLLLLLFLFLLLLLERSICTRAERLSP